MGHLLSDQHLISDQVTVESVPKKYVLHHDHVENISKQTYERHYVRHRF